MGEAFLPILQEDLQDDQWMGLERWMTYAD